MRIPYRPDALYYPPRRCPTGKMKKVKVTATAVAATVVRAYFQNDLCLRLIPKIARSPGTNRPSVLTGSCYGPDGACFRIPEDRLHPGMERAIGTTNLTCRLFLLFVQHADRTGPLDSCRSRLLGMSSTATSSLSPSFFSLFSVLDNSLEIHIFLIG